MSDNHIRQVNGPRPCTKCGEIKLLDDFVKSSKASTGRASICKQCNGARKRAWSTKPKRMPPPHYLERYVPVPESGCWLWDGPILNNGYGRVSAGKRDVKKLPHRLFYEAHKGPVPKDFLVCHKCDTPLCVNPDHLFLGSHADNAADKVRKGRHRNGSQKTSKLPTPAQGGW